MAQEAEIRTVARDPAIEAMEPASIIVNHHRAGRAEIKTQQLGGGNLLHLALAGCVFNNVLRISGERGIRVTDAGVVVTGGFSEDGMESTGIACKVTIKGEGGDDVLVKIARDAFDDSSIAAVLNRCTTVELEEISTG